MPPELLVRAQRISQRTLNPPREGAAVSLGIRANVLLQRRRQPRTGAAGWLERRRFDTAKAALETPRIPPVDSTAAWTEKHATEVKHQKQERHLRACAAVEEGTAPRSMALGGRVAADAGVPRDRGQTSP